MDKAKPLTANQTPKTGRWKVYDRDRGAVSFEFLGIVSQVVDVDEGLDLIPPGGSLPEIVGSLSRSDDIRERIAEIYGEQQRLEREKNRLFEEWARIRQKERERDESQSLSRT